MLLRMVTIRTLLLLTAATMIIYGLIFPLLLQSNQSSRVTDPIRTSSYQNRIPSPPSASSILAHSSMYDEYVELFYPLRTSPSELAGPRITREWISEPLPFNEDDFRNRSFPILWLDEQFDVRWNEVAQRGMLAYLAQKQFPQPKQFSTENMTETYIRDICRYESLFVLDQHWSGFFSRVLCFIAQFGQTLYSPRMAVLKGTGFIAARGRSDDFLSEGILRYFLPFSTCSAYMHNPKMKFVQTIVEDSTRYQRISRTHDLYAYGIDKGDHMPFSSEFWKFDYHHVPIRKWLFDRKKTSIEYSSPLNVLTNHSDEHIYAVGDQKKVKIGEWIDRNKPDAFSSDLLPNDGNYTLTWKDYVFGSFARYMFVLFFGSQNAPRIELSTRVLAQHWLSYLSGAHPNLIDKNDIFAKLAGVYIRRGDKMSEDSFWYKNKRWRNISYYVKGIVDEEKRRKTTFQHIFVMTDDVNVMHSIQDFAKKESPGKDEPYAREHLRGRDILYNVLAPQACFDPFQRIGFDQFLVSMRFLIEYSAFTVGHTDSNVFRFFREIVFARRQHEPGVQSFTYVRNAPDSF